MKLLKVVSVFLLVSMCGCAKTAPENAHSNVKVKSASGVKSGKADNDASLHSQGHKAHGVSATNSKAITYTDNPQVARVYGTQQLQAQRATSGSAQMSGEAKQGAVNYQSRANGKQVVNSPSASQVAPNHKGWARGGESSYQDGKGQNTSVAYGQHGSTPRSQFGATSSSQELNRVYYSKNASGSGKPGSATSFDDQPPSWADTNQQDLLKDGKHPSEAYGSGPANQKVVVAEHNSHNQVLFGHSISAAHGKYENGKYLNSNSTKRSVDHGYVGLGAKDRAHFAFDSFYLTSEQEAIIVRAAHILRSESYHSLVIEGHTDIYGSQEYNLGLGKRRALVVKKILVREGIPSDKIKVISYGKSHLVSHTDQALNRRAVIVVK